MFQALILRILKGLLADPDKLLDLLASWIPGWRTAAEATDTPLDDMALDAAEATIKSPEFREHFREWLLNIVGQGKVLAAMSPDDLRAWVESDGATQSLAGRLNIDWAKLMEWVMKILPLILPIFLEPKPE